MDDIKNRDQYYDFDEDASERGGIHSFRTRDSEPQTYAEYKKKYGGFISRLNEEEDFDDYDMTSPMHLDPDLFEMESGDIEEVSGGMHVANAHFSGDIEKVIVNGISNESSHSFFGDANNDISGLDDSESQNQSNLPTIYVENVRADITTPLSQELWSIASAYSQQDREHHRESLRMTEALIRAVGATTESSEAYKKALEANSHPVAKSLRMLNRLVITPTLRLAGNLLFGFKKESTVEEKILAAIKEQTEFMMSGEIGGRGFFQRLTQRGIVGSLIGGLANQAGLLEKAQQRENAKSRGENVDTRWYTASGIFGNIVDRLSEKDITRRGRNGEGRTEFNDAEKSHTKRIIEYFVEKTKKPEASNSPMTFEGDYTVIDSDELKIDSMAAIHLDNLTIETIKSLVFNDGGVFSDLINQQLDGIKLDAVALSTPIINNESETSAKIGDDSGLKQKIVFDSMEDSLDDINVRMEVQNDNILNNIHSNGEDSLRRQKDSAQSQERFSELTLDELRDIHSFTKETAKETEKVRKQGFFRMLLGIGSTVVGAISSVISTVASVGSSIVAAIAALGAGKMITDFIGNRRGNKGGRTSTPPRTERPHTVAGNPKASVPASSGLNTRLAGGAAAAVAAYGIYNTVTADDGSTFKDKSTDVGGIAGGAAGGWGGAVAGAKLGAALGSFAPGIGNAIGAVAGSIIGGIAGSMIGDSVGESVGSAVGSVGEFFGADDGKPTQYSIRLDGPQEDEMTLLDKVRQARLNIPGEEPTETAKKEKEPETTLLDGIKSSRLELPSIGDVYSEISGDIQNLKQKAKATAEEADLTGISERVQNKTGDVISFLSGENGLRVGGGSEFKTPTVNDLVRMHVEKTGGTINGEVYQDGISSKYLPVEPQQNTVNEIVTKEETGGLTALIKELFSSEKLSESSVGISEAIQKMNPYRETAKDSLDYLKEDISSFFSKLIDFDFSGASDSFSNGIDSAKLYMNSGEMQEDFNNIPKDSSELIRSIGRDIRNGFDSLGDMINDDAVKPIQNVASSIDFDRMFEKSSLNITEKTEESNEFLKTIAKTLNDMFTHQKRESMKEPTDDNSSILDSFTNFLSGA